MDRGGGGGQIRQPGAVADERATGRAAKTQVGGELRLPHRSPLAIAEILQRGGGALGPG